MIRRTQLGPDVSADVAIPAAPFYGSRVVEDISLDDVFAFVNETALFKGQWQFKQGRKPAEEYQAFVRETVRPIFEELKERCKREAAAGTARRLRLLSLPVVRQRSDHLSR